MWMRSYARCKTILRKLRLCDSVRLSMRMGLAGLRSIPFGLGRSGRRRRKAGGQLVADVVEFYIPSTFQNRLKWTPPEQRGKLIDFCMPAKKSA